MKEDDQGISCFKVYLPIGFLDEEVHIPTGVRGATALSKRPMHN